MTDLTLTDLYTVIRTSDDADYREHVAKLIYLRGQCDGLREARISLIVAMFDRDTAIDEATS